MEKIKIRKAVDEDLPSIYEIERKVEDAWSYEILKGDLIGNEFSTYLVAEIDEKIVGFISVMNIVREVHINNIVVDKEYRGKGIGEKLLEHGIGLYPREDIFGVTLEVRVDNIAAKSLYEKFGFVEVGRRKNYYKNNKDGIIMWKFYEEPLC